MTFVHSNLHTRRDTFSTQNKAAKLVIFGELFCCLEYHSKQVYTSIIMNSVIIFPLLFISTEITYYASLSQKVSERVSTTTLISKVWNWQNKYRRSEKSCTKFCIRFDSRHLKRYVCTMYKVHINCVKKECERYNKHQAYHRISGLNVLCL